MGIHGKNSIQSNKIAKSVKSDTVQEKNFNHQSSNLSNQGEKISSLQEAIKQQKEKENEKLNIINKLRDKFDKARLSLIKSPKDENADKKSNSSQSEDEENVKYKERVSIIQNKDKYYKQKDAELQKTFMERVFWTKEQMKSVREKFKVSMQKIQDKTQQDFEELENAIVNKEKDRIL